jgi:hypothetical protein
MDLRFTDHPSFHRATVGMVGGAALFGMALHPLTPMAPLAGGLLGIAAGASLAHGRTPWRMLAAAVAMIPLFAMHATWPALAIVASVMSLAVAAGSLRGVRGALAVCLGAAVTMLGMWTALRIGHARETMAWPPLAQTAVSAAAFGLVGVIAMIPRHVRMVFDPVTTAMRALPTKLDSEIRALCERSMTIWTGAKEKLDENDSGLALVRDGVLKTLEVAAKSADVEVTGASDALLATRMSELDAKIAASIDAEAKAQYQSARAALDDQRRYRDRIHQGKDRMIARMHNHVAALEKFQLAATGLEAARAASAGTMKQLEELSSDVTASGEALADLDLENEPAVAAIAAIAPKADTAATTVADTTAAALT